MKTETPHPDGGQLPEGKDPIDAWRDVRMLAERAMKIPQAGSDTWANIQEIYFKAEFEVQARKPGFPDESFDPHRINISDGRARKLDGISAVDPTNPFINHAVTIDHVIDAEGNVECEINAVPVDEVGTRQGSHIV